MLLRAISLFLLLASLSAAQVRLSESEAAQLKQQIQAALEAQKNGHYDEAAAGFEAVLQRLPDLAEAHMSLGMVRHAQLRYREAIPELEKALQLKPALKGVRGILGMDYLQTGAAAKAVELLSAAATEDPANAQVQGWLGMAYVNTGEFRKAIPYLDTALQAKASDPSLLAYQERAYGGAAVQVHEQLLDLAKHSVEAHLALAEVYSAQNQRDAAITEYRAAAAMNPKYPGVNGALGDLYMDSSQPAEAETCYRKELELTPDLTLTQLRMGMVLTELGRSSEALSYLKRALAQNPSDGEGLFYLGRVEFDLKQYDQAGEALRGALGQPLSKKHERAAHYQLAALYRQMGKPEEAAKQTEMFRRLDAEMTASKEGK